MSCNVHGIERETDGGPVKILLENWGQSVLSRQRETSSMEAFAEN